MKRLDYKLEGDLLIKAFPKHRIDERRELLIILLEAIRYIFIADKIEEKDKATDRLVLYIDDMQRLFFFSENKYYSIMLPFTMKIDNDVVTFYYCGINIDAELVSNFISILNSDLYNSQSCWDFMTPIYELETKNVNFWKIFSYLLSCDLGYLRFDYDEKGFLDAQKRGTPHIHPKHHLDINFSNSSTFKSGLIKKISQQEFIDIVDNKKKRWFLIFKSFYFYNAQEHDGIVAYGNTPSLDFFTEIKSSQIKMESFSYQQTVFKFIGMRNQYVMSIRICLI